VAEPFRCLSLDLKIRLLVKVCGMGAVAFDTHKVVKDLKQAGFNDQQAEAVVSAARRLGRISPRRRIPSRWQPKPTFIVASGFKLGSCSSG